ncbi:MAG: hypothetical protein V7677_02025 [Motiliproteus sp.]
MKTNKIILFVGVPVLTNLLFMGLYFSGIEYAQHIVSPIIDWLPSGSWREFGVIEQLQNIYLLVIIVVFIIAVFKKPFVVDKSLFLFGTLIVVFLFLEEVDYGIHFYEYFIGQSSGIEVRNWHNQKAVEGGGGQNVKYLKQAADLAMVIWFIIFPILSSKINWLPLKNIIPSRWFIIGFIISIVFSRCAHFLQEIDLDVINGIEGGLRGNLSEFRETNTYYFYMLYGFQLFRTGIYSANSRLSSSNA